MTRSRVVPVAYVTKWATTAGIITAKRHETSESFPDCLRFEGSLMRPSEWTEDKALAEERWRHAMKKAHEATVKKAERLAEQILAGPKWGAA